VDQLDQVGGAVDVAGDFLDAASGVTQNAVRPADLGAAISAVVAIRGFGRAVGVVLLTGLLTRRTGPAAGTEAVAAAIPQVIVWRVPLAALVAFQPAETTPSRR
jgi:hypothetical protein